MKNKKKKFIKTPKRSGLLYLFLLACLVIIIFAIFIPINYVKEYKENKVTPFESDLANIEDVQYVDSLSDITDFNLVVECSQYIEYENEDPEVKNCTATFKVYAYRLSTTNEEGETVPDETVIQDIKVKLALCSSWVSVNEIAGVKKVTLRDTKEAVKSTDIKQYTFASLPNLPLKGDLPFIKINSLPLYVYLSYNIKLPNTGKTVTKHFVIEIEYDDYIKGAHGGITK